MKAPGRRHYFWAVAAAWLCCAVLVWQTLQAGAGEAPPRGNLLRNANFRQSTNWPLPDYWDLHHAAGLAWRTLHKQYYLDEQAPSPVAGARVLVLVQDEPGFHHAILLPSLPVGKLPEGDYTFSCYARADREGAELKVQRFWADLQAPARLALGRKWQRYTVAFRVVGQQPQPVLRFPGPATYQLAAPQFEAGFSASAFQPAALDLPGEPVRQEGAATGPGESFQRAGVPASRPGPVPGQRPRHLTVGGLPFFLIGMEVGAPDELPGWYLDDLGGRGINTLFLSARQNATGEYDLMATARLLDAAQRRGFKVVLGRPLMGHQEPQWRKKLAAFGKLVSALKDDPAVIAWEPLDEPAAASWSDAEVREVSRFIKARDPGRPVFMNWAYDGIPSEIGREPRGTLAASDVYSMDYYPFAGEGRSLAGFTRCTLRSLETARRFDKASHGWIQLYGGMDAWREPTPEELGYLVYLNLVYGGSYSYWNTKSNSQANWRRIGKLNRQAKTLAAELFLNPEAREVGLPEPAGNFVSSLWQTPRGWYLIVLHNGEPAEPFGFPLGRLADDGFCTVRSLFERRAVQPQDREIRETFKPFQSRVYLVTPPRESLGPRRGIQAKEPGA